MQIIARWAVLLLLTTNAFATDIEEDEDPAPAAPIDLSRYSHFELKDFVLNVEDPGSSDEAARDHLQSELTEMLDGAISRWNRSAPEGELTVVIEPLIEDLRFIRSGWRILAGPLLRGSHVTVRLVITELPSGRALLTQEFSDSTNAFTGAVTFGISDNRTLSNVAEQIGEYLLACHPE